MRRRTVYLLASIMAVATIAGGYAFTSTMVAQTRLWEESNTDLSAGAVLLVRIAGANMNYWWLEILLVFAAWLLLAAVVDAFTARKPS